MECLPSSYCPERSCSSALEAHWRPAGGLCLQRRLVFGPRGGAGWRWALVCLCNGSGTGAACPYPPCRPRPGGLAACGQCRAGRARGRIDVPACLWAPGDSRREGRSPQSVDVGQEQFPLVSSRQSSARKGDRPTQRCSIWSLLHAACPLLTSLRPREPRLRQRGPHEGTIILFAQAFPWPLGVRRLGLGLPSLTSRVGAPPPGFAQRSPEELAACVAPGPWSRGPGS